MSEAFHKRKASQVLFDRIFKTMGLVGLIGDERARVRRAIREELQLAYARGFNEGAAFLRGQALERIAKATETPTAKNDEGVAAGLLASADIVRRA